jgi:hypothetical protein
MEYLWIHFIRLKNYLSHEAARGLSLDEELNPYHKAPDRIRSSQSRRDQDEEFLVARRRPATVSDNDSFIIGITILFQLNYL